MAIEQLVPSTPERIEEWAHGFNLELAELVDDPYPFCERLRSECPVVQSDSMRCWVVARHEDAATVMQHSDVFSTRDLGLPPFEYPLGPEIPLQLDAPEHMLYRKPMLELFSPAHAASLEGQARESARALLAPIAAKGRCDFLKEFSVPFPCVMFCEMMGLPTSDLDTFARWKDEYLHSDPVSRPEKMGEIYAGVMGMFDRIWDERTERGEPGGDMIGHFMTLEVGGERPITKNEFIRTARMFFFAGLDTVTAQLSISMYHLSTRPDLRDQLVADPSVIPGAVEELMRYDTLVANVRYATEDFELHGRHIPAGDHLILLLNSAGRDSDQFEHADEIDFGRAAANRHLGFGIGPHRCLGLHLARMEIRVALEEIHRLIPTYRLDESAPLTWHLGQVRGLDAFHLVID